MSISELFSALHTKGIMPGPSVDSFASPSFKARQVVLEQQEEQEELDLQTAMELSFANLREASKNKVDQQQKEIQDTPVAFAFWVALVDGYGKEWQDDPQCDTGRYHPSGQS